MKTSQPSPVSRIREDFWLLVSTAAALCLFLLPSKMTILLEAAIFGMVFLSVLICTPDHKTNSGPIPVLLAAVFSAIGFHTFTDAWERSGIMETVAGIVHLPVSVLVTIIGLVGACAAFYGFWRLARWIDRSISRFFDLPDGCTMRNLKANWYFILSAGIFFWLENSRTRLFFLGIPVAVLILAMAAGKAPSLWKLTLDTAPGTRIFSALNALGICWSAIPAFAYFRAEAGITGNYPNAIWLILAACASFPFVYICVVLFWRWLWTHLKTGLGHLTSRERLVSLLILVVLMVLTVFAFSQSDAFYGTEFPYDILYTSDSHILVEGNTYLTLAYEENDLRQPLFALFSAPFMGIATLLSNTFSLSATGNAIVMNWVQVAVLVLSLVLLSEVLELSGWKRITFLLLGALSYPFLLFSLMMEQYIFSVFYVILALYLCAEGKTARPAVWGAGGTLLTSLVLLPATCKSHPVKQFSGWFSELLNHAVEFVFLMLAFCRQDIILDAAYSLEKLSSFSQNTLTWGQKIFRYTQFVRGCILVPPSDSLHNPSGILSWQLIPAETPDWIGIGILVLCILSAVLNFRKPSSRIAAAWASFSVVILLLLGWGAPENGQILYALYFGWAFLVLLYQLVQWCCHSLKLSKALPYVTLALALVLAAVNIPAIATIIAFSKAVFPL